MICKIDPYIDEWSRKYTIDNGKVAGPSETLPKLRTFSWQVNIFIFPQENHFATIVNEAYIRSMSTAFTNSVVSAKLQFFRS